jgi:hypothetical protein
VPHFSPVKQLLISNLAGFWAVNEENESISSGVGKYILSLLAHFLRGSRRPKGKTKMLPSQKKGPPFPAALSE